METIKSVDDLIGTLSGTPRPEAAARIAEACLGWPYVFGAWGEECTPAGRRRRASNAHPTIVSKCQVLSGGASSCTGCKWGAGVRMYDCRGFTHWVLKQVGIEITGGGCTTQYNTAKNWAERGEIRDMPDVVCCVFKKVNNKMEHTGLHVGGGRIIHCGAGVQTGKTSDKSWTHYAIPAGLYSDEEIPTMNHPTLRRGDRGDAVVEAQSLLRGCGYDPGTIDGIFGANTKAAVEAFQGAQGLTPDGIIGPRTWAALEGAEQRPADTFYVTIEGVTWEQYRRILDICPLAEATKE